MGAAINLPMPPPSSCDCSSHAQKEKDLKHRPAGREDGRQRPRSSGDLKSCPKGKEVGQTHELEEMDGSRGGES